MNRKEAARLLDLLQVAVIHGTENYEAIRERILDAMTVTTVEQNVGTIEKGANVTGVKIDRLG